MIPVSSWFTYICMYIESTLSSTPHYEVRVWKKVNFAELSPADIFYVEFFLYGGKKGGNIKI